MNAQRRLSRIERLGLAAFGLVGAVLLLTASRLSPDQRGYGTHEQLGLAPCALYAWTGWRCPSCGMTTSWAYAMHGELIAALEANAGGAMLCGLVVVAAPWALVTAVRGTWMLGRPSPHWLLWIGSGWLTMTTLDWARRIAAG